MQTVEQAKRILTEGGYTCVLYRDGEKYVSTLRGVRPLLDFLESGKSYAGYSAADKTVGAGAAHLYILLGVKEIWANVISQPALSLLEASGIAVAYGTLVPFIRNRSGDGVCPIETAVRDIPSSPEALNAIRQTLARLAQMN